MCSPWKVLYKLLISRVCWKIHFFGRVSLLCGSFRQAKNEVRSAYFTTCVKGLVIVSDPVFSQLELLFDGVVGTDVRLEEMQIRTAGPCAIEREACWPYAAQIGATYPISPLVVPGVVGADTRYTPAVQAHSTP